MAGMLYLGPDKFKPVSLPPRRKMSPPSVTLGPGRSATGRCAVKTEELVEELAAHILRSLYKVWATETSDVLQIDDEAYIQWAMWPEGLQYECVSDEFLPDDRKLSFAQRRLLGELGFLRPSADSPNYYQRCYDRQDLPRVAQVLARAAIEVYDFWTVDDAGEEVPDEMTLFDFSVDDDRMMKHYHDGSTSSDHKPSG
jgi:hypothetical protein